MIPPAGHTAHLAPLEEGLTLARVIAEHKGRYAILVNNQERTAEITGKMMFEAVTRKDYPAVGDWVAVQMYDGESPCIIHRILPRTTTLSRKTSGKEMEEQIIAVNVDIVFIVQGLDHDFNLRRLERFLVVASQSGAAPVILLSKTDLHTPETMQEVLQEVHAIAKSAPVIAYSAKTMQHLDVIKQFITTDVTVCFVGSSGAGKSTLINRLLGREKLATQEVRSEDSKGKHTTTHRELIHLPDGGCVIDTPGLREIGLWDADTSIDTTFADIIDLGLQCRFTDCTHNEEPGCAVRAAIDDGSLDEGRYISFLKLQKEADFIAAKTDITKQQERKAREKKLGKLQKEYQKQRRKG
ncbi:MAG: ribosome small subunit-dependent GTPase A [Bacteroidetes bacterium]|nr:ribosome small subunit-dependent GTPase A [Bacteroidota bacterium]